MRKLLLFLTMFFFLGCNPNFKESNPDENGYPKVLRTNGQWEIIQINDSVVVLTPGLNNSNAIPIAVNLNNIKQTE